jgi:DNA-binding CsgD family transcriptional regulator
MTSAYLAAAMIVPSRAQEAATRLAPILAREMEETTVAQRALLSNVLLAQLFQAEPHGAVRELAERLVAGGALIEQDGSDTMTLWHAVGVLSWADSLGLSDRISSAALADARRRGSAVTMAQCFYARSWPRYWMGRIAEATADAQAAVDAWSGGWGMYLPSAAYWLALALLERDDVEGAAKALDLGPDAEERWGATGMWLLLLSGRGRVEMARGNYEAARANHLNAGESFKLVTVNPAVMPWRSDAAIAAAQLDDLAQARELVDEEIRLARRFGAPRPIGIALRAAGLVEGGARGIELLREAVEVLGRSEAVLERARALVDLGAALRREGERTAARDLLRQGLDAASRFGALTLERQAGEELLAAGARPRRKELTGPESLTPSEQRVAEMAAEGMTNREIAQALFVTVKAVQWHLRNLYRKLEIEGREELGAALEGGPSDDT